jgi:hypothetical protein
VQVTSVLISFDWQHLAFSSFRVLQIYTPPICAFVTIIVYCWYLQVLLAFKKTQTRVYVRMKDWSGPAGLRFSKGPAADGNNSRMSYLYSTRLREKSFAIFFVDSIDAVMKSRCTKTLCLRKYEKVQQSLLHFCTRHKKEFLLCRWAATKISTSSSGARRGNGSSLDVTIVQRAKSWNTCGTYFSWFNVQKS